MDHLTVYRNYNSSSPTPSVDSISSSNNSTTGVYIYRSRSFNFKRNKDKHQSTSSSTGTCENEIRDNIALQSNEIDFDEPPYLTNKIKETRPRCNTDPTKFKNPRSGVLDKLVKHTIHMKSSPIAIAVRSPSPVNENTQQQKNLDYENELSYSEQLTDNEQINSNTTNLNSSTNKMDNEDEVIETTTTASDTNTDQSIPKIVDAENDDLNTKEDLNSTDLETTKDIKIAELPIINISEDHIKETSDDQDDSQNDTDEAIEAIEYNLVKNYVDENKNENFEHTEDTKIENITIELAEDNKTADTGNKMDKGAIPKSKIKIEYEIKTNIESEESKVDKNPKLDPRNDKVIEITPSKNKNSKNDSTDGNVINKIINSPDQNSNDNHLSDNATPSIATISKLDPKYMQYFDNILLSSPQYKLLLNNEQFTSLSDSNIDIPSKNLKRIQSELKAETESTSAPPSTDSSQMKTGVKKSYSCIGKFNQDSDDFYCKVDEKSRESQKYKKDSKKSNKMPDDLNENSYYSDNQLSSSPSSSTTSSDSSKQKTLLRQKTDLTTTVLNNIKQRPKSTPTPVPKSSSIQPSTTTIVEKKQLDTTGSAGSSSAGGAPILKRESFIRQSFNKLFRKNSTATQFSNPSSSNSSNSSNSSSNSDKSNNQNNNGNGSGGASGVERFLNSIIGGNIGINSNSNNNQKSDLNDDFAEVNYDNVKSMDFDEYIHNSNKEEVKKKIKFLNDIDKYNKSINDKKCPIKIRIYKVPSESDLSKLTNDESKQNIGIRKNNSFIVNTTKRSTNNVNIGIRSTTDSQMAPLQGQSETNGQSIINLSTLNKNQNHYQSSNNLNQNNSNNSNQNINNYNNSNNNNINTNNLNSSNSNLNSGTNNLKTSDTKSQKQISSSPIASSSETKQQQLQQQSSIITTTTTSSSSGGSGQQQQQQQLQSTHNNYQQQQSQERPTRSISPHPIKSQSTSSVLSVINDTKSNSSVTVAKNDIPEKEKKRKELSSSRKKKFHRHFQQVSKDERVLNYFSCALVSDILLQGHLYITENYFAFYSNVFGFVTKLLIPTSSVVKISKEKTAKIIPNAVGVATIDERHVFGSFMSREAAFRLMCSVCPPLEATESIVISPKLVPVDGAEICEESVEDDSSCSISGNESPAQLKAGDSGGGNTQKSGSGGNNNCGNSSSDASHTLRHRAIPINKNIVQIASNDSILDNDLLSGDIEGGQGKIQLIIGAGTPIKVLKSNQQLPIKTNQTTATTSTIGFSLSADKSITSTTSSSYSTSPSSLKKIKDKLISLIHFKFPTEVHVVYIGIFLAVMLTLFSLYLMYRILDIEAKASYRSTVDISNKWSSSDDDNNDNVYAEALKWQKELQAKSTEEAQNILSNNLELIARVRKSLKALSMLIHDRHVSSTSNYETQYGNSIIREHDDEIIS